MRYSHLQMTISMTLKMTWPNNSATVFGITQQTPNKANPTP